MSSLGRAFNDMEQTDTFGICDEKINVLDLITGTHVHEYGSCTRPVRDAYAD